MSIVVKEVTKFYGEQHALKDVSFEVHPGKIVGFIGPNGAGKSTMMKIMCGLFPPDKGSVSMFGYDAIFDSLNVRRILGYLPENNPLYYDMYVREYLSYVAGLYGLRRGIRSRIDGIVEMTGLSTEQHKKIGSLSKGYRQRVGLGQALIHDPRVLILDEPTTGLDPNQIIEIRNLIFKLGKEKTVILSTHIMQEVEAICDRVIIINKGRILAHDEAMNIKDYSLSVKQTVHVEFKISPGPEKLRSIKGVMQVRQIDDTSWLLEGEEGPDLRSEVFQFAVDNNLMILSLQKKDKRLEDVFHELTK